MGYDHGGITLTGVHLNDNDVNIIDGDMTADSLQELDARTIDSTVGPIITRLAQIESKTPAEMVRQLLYHVQPVTYEDNGRPQHLTFIPGNTFDGKVGPLTGGGSDVMVIGQMPNKREVGAEALLQCESGELLRDTLVGEDVDVSRWYYTTVVKFNPENSGKGIKAKWVKECRILLDMEFDMLKPKYILLLGTEAVKSLYGPRKNMSRLRGATDLTYRSARVFVTINPAAIIASPSLMPGFQRDIKTFTDLVKGNDITQQSDTHYEAITRIDRLVDVVTDIINEWETDPTAPRRLAIDTEWGSWTRSNHRQSEFRCIQFAHKPKVGYTVVLRRAGREPTKDDPGCPMVYDPLTCCNEQAVVEVLNLLLAMNRVRVAGHNFRGDLIRLKRIGIDCTKQFQRGIDTMLAYHLMHPAEEDFGLEYLAMRYTDLGRYDIQVEEWLIANKYRVPKGSKNDAAVEVGKRKLRRFGFANVPDDLLFDFYAPADVDVVMRSWDIIEPELREAMVTNPYSLGSGVEIRTLYDLYANIVQPCNQPLEEIEVTGMATDVERLKRLTELFIARREEMLTAFRTRIKWPDFNFRSSNQLREFLFGDALCSKPVRPSGATTLDLQPVKTTEKPSRDWRRVPDHVREAKLVSPSTDGESLAILGGINPLAGQLQKLKFVDQIIKNFLRPPSIDAAGITSWNEGLVGLVDDDERIRTTISQITDTGRYRSYDPNLQNLPKKQESELRQIFSPDPEKLKATKKWQGLTEDELKKQGLLHPEYYTLRSCLKASRGHVLIEADYKQAELNVLAHLSGDPDMIMIMNDPSRDFHSEMAVSAFQLKCKPEEVKGLHPRLRIVAKATNFGQKMIAVQKAESKSRN